MTTLAIQKIDWEALLPEQKEGLRISASLPRLGEPAHYIDEGGVEWAIFDDNRISEEQVAVVAALMENPSSIPLPIEEGEVV